MTARVRLATAAGLLAIGTLTGCAVPLSRAAPAYPSQGQPPDLVAQDQAACTTWAETTTPSSPVESALFGATGGALAGAIVGAIIGAVVGAPFGLAGTLAGQGAALGAATWGIAGAGQGAAQDQRQLVSAYAACMTGRGYSVGF